MEVKQVEILFRQFLLNKGYTSGNLLSQVELRTAGDGVFRPGLVILDTNNKEYVAIIEFKSKIDDLIRINTLGQFYKYFSLLGTQAIPAYLVFPISEDDFQILCLTKENTFEPITREEFPSFETLSAKRLTEEKLRERELEFKTIKELELKKQKSRIISYWSIVSLIIGITITIIAIFLQQNDLFKKRAIISNDCCDSIQIKFSQINKQIFEIEKKIKIANLNTGRVDTIYTTSNISLLDQRLKIIEKGISDNPEKALSILRLNNEIEKLRNSVELIRDMTSVTIESLNDKINFVTNVMFGIFVTIFGAILGYAFTNLRPNKNNNTA